MPKQNNDLIDQFFKNLIVNEQTPEVVTLSDISTNLRAAHEYTLAYKTKDNIAFGEVLSITPSSENKSAKPGEEKGYVYFNGNMTDKHPLELKGDAYLRTRATWDAFNRTMLAINLRASPDPQDIKLIKQNQKKSKVGMKNIFMN